VAGESGLGAALAASTGPACFQRHDRWACAVFGTGIASSGLGLGSFLPGATGTVFGWVAYGLGIANWTSTIFDICNG
jgi:hypothetical protein